MSTVKNKEKTKESSNDTYKSYTTEIEEKIEAFLLSVDGVKNVNVIVTLDTIDSVTSSDNSAILGINSNNTKTICPTVRGVAISCTDGDNDEIKNKITRLVSAFLGIPTNRIEIVNFG